MQYEKAILALLIVHAIDSAIDHARLRSHRENTEAQLQSLVRTVYVEEAP